MKIFHLGSLSASFAVIAFSLLQLGSYPTLFVSAKKIDQHAGNLRNSAHAAEGSSGATTKNDLLEAYRSLSDDDKANFLEHVLPKVDDTIVDDPNFLTGSINESEKHRMLQSTNTLAPGSFGTCQVQGQIFLCSGDDVGGRNDCLPNPCRNGGSCYTNANGSFKGCSCPSEYGGEKCEIDLGGGGVDGVGGTTTGCHGQWIKHKDHVCRTSDGGNGDVGNDFKIKTNCDKECCATTCCNDPECKAYEHKDERCELWSTLPTRLEYKVDNRCYIKPSADPWSSCSSNNFSCWWPDVARIGYFYIQSFDSNMCWTRQEDDGSGKSLRLRLENCELTNEYKQRYQSFHFHPIQDTQYWNINYSSVYHVEGTSVDPDSSGSQGKLVLSDGEQSEETHSFFKLDYNAQRGTFRIRIVDSSTDSDPQKRLYVTQQSGESESGTPLVLRTEQRMNVDDGYNNGHYILIPDYY